MPTWIIEGADKVTGNSVLAFAECGNRYEAEDKASKAGVLVSKIREDDPAAPIRDRLLPLGITKKMACDNCGRNFGNLETPRIFEGNQICAQCQIILDPQSTTLALISARVKRKRRKFVIICAVFSAVMVVGGTVSSSESYYAKNDFNTNGIEYIFGAAGFVGLAGLIYGLWGFVKSRLSD